MSFGRKVSGLAVLLTLSILAGCSTNARLESLTQQQAQTIKGLNAEISRLNAEIDRCSQSCAQ